MIPVVDLHCDLLFYLATGEGRSPNDSICRCSLPQLKQGCVELQTLAIYTETGPDSVLLGQKQMEILQTLPKEKLIPAFENASSFASENEPLEQVFTRLSHILTQFTPLYISLTWNNENRFGGGCGSQIGLKEDGKELLTYLSGRGIAIDFSHTSDPLAHDIFNFIDKKGLQLPVLASHSNFRTVHYHLRNLPDAIAQEIINRNGIIGLVAYRKFLASPSQLSEQIAYGFKLGGEKAMAFGNDFFYLDDFPSITSDPTAGFFPEMANSSHYPATLARIKKELNLNEDQLHNIASKNAYNFMKQSERRHAVT